MPETIYRAWKCPDCGHWSGSSYLQAPPSNPDWRPRCKMKNTGPNPVDCSRPLMEPLLLVPTQQACPACGGSGLHADELERAGEEMNDDIREMLDSTRCYQCHGSGVPSV